MQILSNPISALNVRESPKFSRLLENLGPGTPSGVRGINLPEAIAYNSVLRMRCALRMHYRQITYEVTLLSYDHYKNSSVIVDLAMGQIPRSRGGGTFCVRSVCDNDNITSGCSPPAALPARRLGPRDELSLSRLHRATSSPRPAQPGTSL